MFKLYFKSYDCFVITLTGNGKYSYRNSEKLPQPGQMQLFKKHKTFSQFFALLLKSTSNLPHS